MPYLALLRLAELRCAGGQMSHLFPGLIQILHMRAGISNMKAHFAFVTVLDNQTLVPYLGWGTILSLHFRLG